MVLKVLRDEYDQFCMTIMIQSASKTTRGGGTSSTNQGGLGVVGVVPENLALHQLPGDDVRDHHYPPRLALPCDALP